MRIYFNLFVIFLLPSFAFADTFSSPNMIETSHEVSSFMKTGMLHLSVTRVFKNTGNSTEELVLEIVLPPDSLVTELQYNFSGSWEKTKLVAHNDAEAQYFDNNAWRKNQKVIQKARGAAFLTKDESDYTLRVFPLSPSGTVKIRYTLEILPKYENRKYWILYPQGLDRNIFVEPVFSYSGIFSVGKQNARKEKVKLGHGADSRCRELKLPKTCYVIEVIVDEEKEAKEVSYFTTRLSTVGKREYVNDILRLPHLVLDPSNEAVPIQNCATSGNSVTCRTPVKMQKGKWKFIFSVQPSKNVLFTQEATFENDVGKRRSVRRFFPGYVKLEFEAKSGPNEILLGVDSRKKTMHLEARMRKPFSVLPKHPRMIFLLDTSWSANQKGIARQIKLLKSIVKHTVDETIEVLAYNRFVNYFTINPNHVGRSLKENAKALLPRNGSNLEAALDKARNLVRKGNRPTRIFVMSDLKIFEPQIFEKEYVLDLPQNVVLHLIAINGGRKTALQRKDRLPFSRLAKDNRGISVGINAALEDKFDQESLHLVRPVRVDFVRIAKEKLPDILEGGTFFHLRYRADESYTLEGKLWQDNYMLKVERSKKGDARMRRQKVVSQEASNEETIAFGKKHKVVTRSLSLIGIEEKNVDGRRPRQYSVGARVGHRSSFYRATGRFHPPEINRRVDGVLNGVFETIAIKCQRFGKGAQTYTAEISTTDFEIVSLRRAQDEKKTDWSRCIHEGVWDTKLPDEVKTGSYAIQL